VNYIFCIW